MSKMEILAELPKLELAERREIFDRILFHAGTATLTGRFQTAVGFHPMAAGGRGNYPHGRNRRINKGETRR
jgi:hypothetical protein